MRLTLPARWHLAQLAAMVTDRSSESKRGTDEMTNDQIRMTRECHSPIRPRTDVVLRFARVADSMRTKGRRMGTPARFRESSPAQTAHDQSILQARCTHCPTSNYSIDSSARVGQAVPDVMSKDAGQLQSLSVRHSLDCMVDQIFHGEHDGQESILLAAHQPRAVLARRARHLGSDQSVFEREARLPLLKLRYSSPSQ